MAGIGSAHQLVIVTLLLFLDFVTASTASSRNAGAVAFPYVANLSGIGSTGQRNRDSTNHVQLGDRILKLPPLTERAFVLSEVSMSREAMMRKLNVKVIDGNHFSTETPSNPLRNQNIVYYPILKIPGYVKDVVRRFMRATFGNDRTLRTAHKKTAHSLKRFLSNYSVCPVRYRWYDFGSKYWPRWVRLGTCFDRFRSCSLPPGLHCRPGSLRTLNVLRYLCPVTWERNQCEWRAISFTVLVSCTCGC